MKSFKFPRELVLYCIIGCCGASLDFLLYSLLTKFFGLHYQAANFFSVSLGIINNFFLNRQFNFKLKDHVLKRMVSFYAVGMLGWLLSAASLWFLIEELHFNELIGKLGTIALVTMVQFILNKWVTFRKHKA